MMKVEACQEAPTVSIVVLGLHFLSRREKLETTNYTFIVGCLVMMCMASINERRRGFCSPFIIPILHDKT